MKNLLRRQEGMVERIHNSFASFAIFRGFSSATDSQPARLEADLELVRTKSGNLCARNEAIVRFYDLAFHGLQQLGFRAKPILPVGSGHATTILKKLVGTAGDRIERAFLVFQKFFRLYKFQIDGFQRCCRSELLFHGFLPFRGNKSSEAKDSDLALTPQLSVAFDSLQICHATRWIKCQQLKIGLILTYKPFCFEQFRRALDVL